MHFYTLAMKDQKEKVKKKIPFTIASKENKTPRNKPKGTKHLLPKTCKMLTKEIEDDKKRWKNIYHVLEEEYSQNDDRTQGNLQINCNHFQITNGIFHSTRTIFFMERLA